MPSEEWWHGSRTPLLKIRPFLHVGSLEQAMMRSGRGAFLHRITVQSSRTLRQVDKGSWLEKTLRSKLSAGYDAISYLNRFEGIPLEEFDLARSRHGDIDRLSDSRFRKAVPSARESLIILDPSIARIEDIQRA